MTADQSERVEHPRRSAWDLFSTYYRINRTTSVGADLTRWGCAVDALRLTRKVRKHYR